MILIESLKAIKDQEVHIFPLRMNSPVFVLDSAVGGLVFLQAQGRLDDFMVVLNLLPKV